jgi:beta-alanine--pyruvate transaminase
VGARAFETFVKCFELGLLVRVTGDVIALSPPLIVSREQIDEMSARVGEVLGAIS